MNKVLVDDDCEPQFISKTEFVRTQSFVETLSSSYWFPCSGSLAISGVKQNF